MSNSWAAIRRRNAPLAVLIAAGALCAPACGGTAFTTGDSTGEGGSNSEGGVGDANRGGTANSGSGSHSGGAPATQGGDTSTEGGAGGDPGAGADGGTDTGSHGGVTSGGVSSGGASTGGSVAITGGKGGTGGTAAGGKGGAGGTASGGANKGGSGGTTGGTSKGGSGATTGGTASGGTSTGGTLGVGGLSVGGVLGTGGSTNAPFPANSVLDNFNRGNDMLGASWMGGTDTFVIKEQRLVDTAGDGMPLLWGTRFDASQEVFATLADFDTASTEINLVLRAQQQRLFCELIEVMYQPDRARVAVDMCSNGAWTELPAFTVALVPGDQLGARISADGKISVYRNGNLLTTFNASAFPYTTGGYIGVNAAAQGNSPATWDNFGGGNAPP